VGIPASNSVAAFDTDGKQTGIVFETASPFDTPGLVRPQSGSQTLAACADLRMRLDRRETLLDLADQV
jgi:hypothetical protein